MPIREIPHILRYPVLKNDPLQGWDAADELLLEYLREQDLEGKRILILNDQFGAISCGLAGVDATTFTDSFVSAQGIRLNSAGTITPVSTLDELRGKYDLVLLRIPKNLSFLEDILAHLTGLLHPGAQVICGAMVKHLPKSAFDLLDKFIGATSTSLAKKKARLIFAKLERTQVPSPYPVELSIEGFTTPFTQQSNLFSREKLDIGTRFFLEHIPRGHFRTILDLGCANGIIGIKAKLLNPQAKVIFSDESSMAIESARANFHKYFDEGGEFHWTNSYEDGPANSIDLILCNPPFHQGTTIGDFIAQQMFRDAKRTLKPGGALRVIGNSHLRYGQDLKRLFGNVTVVATNQKFVIWDAKRTT